MASAGLGVAAAALAVASIACSLLAPASDGAVATGGSPSPVAAPTSTTSPVITTFDGSDAAFGALDLAIESNPAAVIEQARSALTAEDPKVRFAAVYALGLTVEPGNADILVPVLEDPDPALRAIAAGALSGLGIKDSLPVLIEALAVDASLPYSDPPLPQWALAESALVEYTGQDFRVGAAIQDGDAPARQAAVEAWRGWWLANAARLTWDAGTTRYVP